VAEAEEPVVTALPLCSCGEAHPHSIATRRSYDGRLVELASDGALWVNGQRTDTLGAAPVRTDAALDRCRIVGAALMGWACVLEAAELSDLYRRGRALAHPPGSLRELRAALDRPAFPPLRWVVQSADRDGRATERAAWLPRLRWPGLVVFDFCGGAGSSRGRYRLFRRLPGRADDRTVEDTGFAFWRLGDLWTHLEAA
jgi:hypothetical protein